MTTADQSKEEIAGMNTCSDYTAISPAIGSGLQDLALIAAYIVFATACGVGFQRFIDSDERIYLYGGFFALVASGWIWIWMVRANGILWAVLVGELGATIILAVGAIIFFDESMTRAKLVGASFGIVSMTLLNLPANGAN
jgi:drug/metabolite transporter (DMT)-like permease